MNSRCPYACPCGIEQKTVCICDLTAPYSARALPYYINNPFPFLLLIIIIFSFAIPFNKSQPQL